MPPTNEERNYVQFAMLEKELATQIADAKLFVRILEERAEKEERVLSTEERNLAQKILNAPVERVIPLESAKLRFFLNHIKSEDWEKFRALAAAVALEKASEEEVLYFVDLYHSFCGEYDDWIKDWIATLDPDTVSALNEAWADRDNPKSVEVIQRITESLILRREREVDRIEE